MELIEATSLQIYSLVSPNSSLETTGFSGSEGKMYTNKVRKINDDFVDY